MPWYVVCLSIPEPGQGHIAFAASLLRAVDITTEEEANAIIARDANGECGPNSQWFAIEASDAREAAQRAILKTMSHPQKE